MVSVGFPLLFLEVIFDVENVQSFGGYVYHSGRISNGAGFHVGDSVELSVNMQRRQPIAANHTCTHVLNNALRLVVGEHCEQKGSLVLQVNTVVIILNLSCVSYYHSLESVPI
jgi:alanyl-tRNA synthetase